MVMKKRSGAGGGDEPEVPIAGAAAASRGKKPFVPLCGRSPNVRILGDIMTPLDWPDPVEKWDRVERESKRKKRK